MKLFGINVASFLFEGVRSSERYGLIAGAHRNAKSGELDVDGMRNSPPGGTMGWVDM